MESFPTMFYIINISPMLVTKSVFKLIFGLSNYQTCAFPLILDTAMVQCMSTVQSLLSSRLDVSVPVFAIKSTCTLSISLCNDFQHNSVYVCWGYIYVDSNGSDNQYWWIDRLRWVNHLLESMASQNQGNWCWLCSIKAHSYQWTAGLRPVIFAMGQ